MNDEDIQADPAQGANLPVEFTFENYTVRTIAKDDEIWFVHNDVCKTLGLKNPSQVISRIDDDEKGVH
jgi:prophage antirepressor-like protein